MKQHSREREPEVLPSTLSRRARLHALLFTGAALGTTLLTLAALIDVKLPRNQGE